MLTEGSSRCQDRIMKRKMKGSQNVELPKREHEDVRKEEEEEEEEEEVKESLADSSRAICSIPVAENYESLLSELETKGFSNKRMNMRLLKKHNGDIDKVTQVLTECSVKHYERIMMRKARNSIVQDEISRASVRSPTLSQR